MADVEDALEISWLDFKKTASQLSDQANAEGSTMLFRGQASSKWCLQTTLERSDLSEEVLDHYRTILRIKRNVEAFTGREWPDAPEMPELEQIVHGGYDQFSLRIKSGDLPYYSYLAYLRHHGFPSPLLDWSASPMVAAFFAFRTRSDSDFVAIYAYRERDASRMKSGGSDLPSIRMLGPYVSAPKRHFMQRSYYTMCAMWDANSPYFYQHSKVCKRYDPKAEFQQDIVYKFALKGEGRREVLTELAEYNLHAYTLFGSDDSLIESLATRAELNGD